MKKDFQAQFEHIRTIMTANVGALRSLMDQSKNLSEIIEKISGSSCDEALSNQLITLRQNIDDSISTLILQTKKLFESYNKLISQMLDK